MTLSLFIFISSFKPLNATNYFKLNGGINIDTGMVNLLCISDKFYLTHQLNYTSKIKNGKFCFEDSISYPAAYFLAVKQNGSLIYVSYLFWISKGEQSINVDVNKGQDYPDFENSCSKELRKYLEFNPSNNDTLLLKYVRNHPDSYVACWEFANKITDNNYKSIYDSVYQYFSPILKSNYVGKIIGEHLFLMKSLKLGALFPVLTLNDSLNDFIFNPSLLKNQYTLIDFWHSSCGPCISQFDEFKKIYSDYKNKGFSIVNIAFERNETIKKWKFIISKYQLPWQQFIDLNGIECKKLNVNRFPNNFLINSQGIIVASDLKPDELKFFLNEKLK